jgi:hypothetical protein
MRVEYDQSIKSSHGFWRCDRCGVSFYGEGEALHRPSCPASGYESCTYCFGDNEIVRLQGLFKSFGLAYFHQCYTEMRILRDYGDMGSNDDVVSMLARYEERLKEVNREHPNVKVFVQKMTDLLTVNVK